MPEPAVVSRRAVLSGLTLAGTAVLAGCARPSRPGSQAARHKVPSGTRKDYSQRATYDWAEAAYRARDQGGGEWGQEARTLAWDEAYALQSYLPMYRATSDLGYLDKLVEHGYRVLEVRDDQRGRPDYRGRAGPVWGSGAPYTVCSRDLLDASGAPMFRLSAAARSTTVRVDVRPRGGTSFDLMIDARPEGSRQRIEGLSTDAQAPGFVVRQLVARSPTLVGVTARDLRPGGQPPVALQPLAGAAMIPARYAFLVHTGMICAPLAEFAVLVRGDQRLVARYATPARHFLAAAQAALAFHDPDWRRLGDQIGLYASARGAPIPADGTYLPHNQYLAAARVRALLYRCTRDPADAAGASLMAGTFLSDLSSGSAPVWPYYWRRSQGYTGYGPEDDVSRYTPRAEPNQALEDTSHGALDVECLIAIHDAGIRLTGDPLRRLTQTFRRRVAIVGADGVVVGANSLAPRSRTGSYDLAVPRWADLARWERDVFRRSLALFNRRQPDPSHGQVLASTAKLVAAR